VGLLAAALALYVLEGLLPRPLPWFRLGLSNAVILLALVKDGAWLALKLSLARTLLGTLFLGTLITPVLLLSLGGSLLAWVGMALLKPLYPRFVGVVGLSLAGAALHAIAQLAVASLLLIPLNLAWQLLPLVLLPALVAGVIVGLITGRVATQCVASRDRATPVKP